MTNLKAIITTAVVLGSSSFALAQPGSVDAYAQGGVRVTTTQAVRDHRAEQPDFYRPIAQPVSQPGYIRQPVLLATTKLMNGRDTIEFASSTSVSSIKLEATKGRTLVSKVKIKFANGQSQIVYPNKTLTGSACIDIAIAGNARHVTSITVFGSANLRSSFEILGA